jgi:site-specific recombinase XerD
MSFINYYLDKPDRKQQCPILLSFISKGSRFRFYTKLKIEESFWDNQKQEVKKLKTGHEEMNSILESYREVIKHIEREALFKRESITTTQLRQKFEIAIGREKPLDDFHSLFDKYLKVSCNTKTQGTVKGLIGSYNKLKTFESQTGYRLTFDSINKNFYDLYVGFLINCNHLNNTIGRFIKTLKFFMNYATDIGINKNLEFKKFKVLDEEVDLIYLTNEELMHLFNIEITDESLYRLRENFCFECFTGLRFSDVSKIENVHFIQENLLKVKTQKTKTELTIPLNQFALKIIERNKGRYENKILPPCFSLQKTNQYLKVLGRVAELNHLIHVVKYSGAKRIESTKSKHELLTTHAARRTFITLSLERGMRPEIVMQIVGIKKWETFKRYIKITDQIKVIEMNSKWNDQPSLKIV